MFSCKRDAERHAKGWKRMEWNLNYRTHHLITCRSWKNNPYSSFLSFLPDVADNFHCQVDIQTAGFCNIHQHRKHSKPRASPWGYAKQYYDPAKQYYDRLMVAPAVSLVIWRDVAGPSGVITLLVHPADKAAGDRDMASRLASLNALHSSEVVSQ
jgi:hypothetical protein